MNDTITSSPATLSLIDEKGSVVKTWRLEGKRTFRIGRAKENEIILPNSWVSRRHSMLQIEANGVFNALDMGSANGTFVNGRRIHTPTPLRSGDLIKIGNRTTLTFLQDYTIPKATDEDVDDDEKTVAFLEKEQVTIMVCDIRGFTSLSEQLGARKISDFIKLWGRKVDEAVSANNGSVDKFIGDAVMAVWAGAECSTCIHQAMRCVLQVAQITGTLAATIPNRADPLRIGAAVNTGEAVIGNIGVDGNRDYSVIGDVVNVAFRLEGLTSKIGKDFLMGDETARHLRADAADYFEPCRYIVKGKKKPVTAHGSSFEALQRYLTDTGL